MLPEPEITAEELDGLIASGTRRFPAVIEARFEDDRADERRRHHLIFNLIGIVVFNAFLLGDRVLVPDIIVFDMILRLGIVTPIALVTMRCLFIFRGSILRESCQAATCTLCFAAIMYLSTLSTSPLAVYHPFGGMLVIVFANVVQRPEFRYAALFSLACMLIAFMTVPRVHGLPSEAASVVLMLNGACILLTLFANWRMEGQLRSSYLFHLRDQIRNRELDALAQIDPLTGLGNRRLLDTHMTALWARAGTAARPVSLLVADVDHFKNYNDFYGHPAGDLCLKRIAAAIAGELRNPADAAFRFGGEEFIVVLDDTELMDGVRIADRIRRAVEQLAIPHEKSGFLGVVTLSMGVAASMPGAAISKNEIITGADTALYAAKRAGRNQVWPPLGKIGGPVAYISEVKARGA